MKKKWSELTKTEQAELIELYKKISGRKACARMGVSYKSARTSLNYHHNKGLGHGGKRENSGNKKGTIFCGNCGKKIENCYCA